jgi:hypothetical protein
MPQTLKKTQTGESTPSRMLLLVGCLALLAMIAVATWWSQRKIYPTATSAESMVLIKKLYTACNLQDAKLLASFERQLAASQSAQQVTAAEFAAFAEIAATAKAGDWKKASGQAFRFARDQRTD